MREARRCLIVQDSNFAKAVLAGIFLCGLLGANVTRAQQCEIPLFVKQGLSGANVMILADNSGSMNAPIFDLRYDHNTEYTGDFKTESTYYVSRDGWYEPRDFKNSWPSSPSAYLVDSDNGQNSRYIGNYLNFIFYHLTDDQRAAVPQVTRIQVLKAVLKNIIERSEQLNFGLTKFQSSRGGSIVGKCGENRTALQAQIDGLTANMWTPLGESMETILDYFSDDGPQAPIQESCQYNFVLVVTDGLPTKDVDVSGYLHDTDGDGREPGNCTSIGAPYSNSYDCSDYFDDVSYYMANEDLRPDLEGEQNVFTYVVGFHENAPLLQQAADNGQGLFFHAENAVELYLSIEYAIQDVLRRISAGSAVAVVSTERGTDDRLYRGKFMPLDWHGYLESYRLPYTDGDEPVWEAGNLLAERSPSSRTIFTALGDQRAEFHTSRAPDLRTALGATSDEEAADLISWGRGGYIPEYRYRKGWILGDIVHSTPVVVGPPSDFVPTESYQNFQNNNAYRTKMVYVGANDGMLHAFDAESGYENWAFVPEFALPAFSVMADSGYCHKYTCDQTVNVKDVKINGSWRTILVSGGGEGSAAIYALDITDPDNPVVKWQADLPNGKTLHSEVEMFSVGGTAVALVGGGLDETNGESWLYAYDLNDGNELGWVSLGSNPVNRNKTTKPAVVDLNLDGEVDLIYTADMLGSVYRIDTNGSPYPGNWDISEFYESSQEITADPVAAYGPDGSVYLYFGTGAYLDDDDVTSTGQQRFVCLFDRHSGRTIRLSDLTNQTSSISDIGDDDGWYVNLWHDPGERVSESAAVVAETVIFTSFAPSGEACVAGGQSWLYQMRYDDGGIPENDDMQDPEDRSIELGEGVASYPVVDLTAGEVVVQSSDASITVAPIATSFLRMAVRSWQESFDNVSVPEVSESIDY